MVIIYSPLIPCPPTMAKFLNTSALNYYLDELIKRSNQKLVLISPFLNFNDRIKELIHEKALHGQQEIRIVYGKTELDAAELAWLKSLKNVLAGFCKNLHAKCYLNESACIIGSLNLYEYSQVNNNEMGVLLSLRYDSDAFRAAEAESGRILRLSEDLEAKAAAEEEAEAQAQSQEAVVYDKLTTSKLAQKMEVRTPELQERLVRAGYLEDRSGRPFLTASGKAADGEFKMGRAVPFFIWPAELVIPERGFLAALKKLF